MPIVEGVGDLQVPLARFIPPKIRQNENGWGPPPSEVPEKFKDLPYQPFSKSDRLGKISDWTGQTYGQDRGRYTNKYASTFGGMSSYLYIPEEDEGAFQLVDSTRVFKPPGAQRGRFNRNMRNMRNMRQMRQGQQAPKTSKLAKMKEQLRYQQQRRKGMGRYGRGGGRWDNKGHVPMKTRESSVTVKPDWVVVEEMDFPRLSKLSLPGIDEGEDLRTCGVMEYYDRQYDRVNTKNEIPLQRIDREIHKVTTTEDPIIRQLAKEDAGNVFATDTILAAIMCSTRSVYSWDVIIQKVGKRLFFDKRDESEIDFLTVGETSNEPPQEEATNINSPQNLALEAVFINHNFSQQVLVRSGESFKFPQPNPFVTEEDEGPVASVGYRYRKWNLGNDIILVARTEHDCALRADGENQFINVRALNEWDPKYSGGIDWRQRLDAQRGAVLAHELKNNSNKIAKWTVQSILAGSQKIKFGYVSRVNVRDSTRHTILGTQMVKPQEFAAQINLNMDNAWGILRCLIDICMKLKDGKYLIVKDPNKPLLRLYDIPDTTFESEESDGSSAEAEGEEGSSEADEGED